MDKQVHQGRAVKRIREILGKKQEELASELGITQQAISLLEAKETLDDKLLHDVAKFLNVPIDSIRNFNEDAAVNFISNTFTDNQFAGYTYNNNPTFNPLDKVVELYERMLQEKNDEIARLKQKLDHA